MKYKRLLKQIYHLKMFVTVLLLGNYKAVLEDLALFSKSVVLGI